MKRSKRWTLNIRDLLHGAIITLITSALGGLTAMFTNLSETGDLRITSSQCVTFVGIPAILSLLSYLLKQFPSNQSGNFKTNE